MVALLTAGILVLGAGFAATSYRVDAARADPCTTATSASCTVAGTATIDTGALTLQGPSTIAWSATLTGFDQTVPGTADAPYEVTDADGTGDGWTVTAAASTVTGSGSRTLPDTGALIFDASTTSADDTTDVPDAACAPGSTCTLPVSTISYPVEITTDASGTDLPYAILDAEAGSGMGSILIGQTTPGVFWLNVPANAAADTYTTTITLTITSGPPS